MIAIWKFPFKVADEVDMLMPPGAELLHVDVQHDQPCVWAKVDKDNALRVQRRLRIYGTGHEVKCDCPHVGSFMLHSGALVFHVFDGGER